MIIKHHTGIPYELKPNTRLEFTRTNPFFSKKGEQSLPITLPASPHNLQLLENPHRADNRKKLESRLDVSIESGIFFKNGRQAVLSAKNKDKITTSFYLRNGAFFEKMNDVSLMEVFAEKELRFSSVDAAIAFCQNLTRIRDARFACFPIVTENYWINRILSRFEGGNVNDLRFFFENAEDTEITINDRQVFVPRGMFISPFVRVRHVVEEVLNYLGYELAPGSFFDIAPFNDMVFLNDTLDTIASGTIRYIDIVPNITISALFDVLRKFNVEPMPDEALKTIHLVSFNDVLASPVQADLSDCIHGDGTMHYHHDFKQLKLSSQRISLPEIIKPLSFPQWTGWLSALATTVNTSRPEASFMETRARFPYAQVERVSGMIMARGFRGESVINREVGSLSLDYSEEHPDFSVDKMRFPDVVPETLVPRGGLFLTADGFGGHGAVVYCGRGRFVQSSMEFSDETYTDLSDERELRPMLCLVDNRNWSGGPVGTLSNYRSDGQKLWDYSLFFNGEDGIFERFWRNRDNSMRNALLEVEYDLLLSEKHKFTLSALEKVMLNNQEYFISEIKYTPEEKDIKSCRFLSVRQQQDADGNISTAKTEAELFPPQPFRWRLETHRTFTAQDGLFATVTITFKVEPMEFFPAPPTQQQFNQGGRFFEQRHEVEWSSRNSITGAVTGGTGIITTWLVAERT